MANPNSSYDEIATTTLESRTKRLADNVSKSTAGLAKLSERGNIKPVIGGEKILQEIEYQENTTFKRYDGGEILDISQSNVFTSAAFDWKQAAVAVVITGKEMMQNSGPERMIELLGARVKNAERTIKNNIGTTDFYSDGTADGSKQIGGLQHLVADDPTTGTVGGINRATFSFWQNIKYDVDSDGSGAATVNNIQTYMNAVWVQVCRGAEHPDIILTDNNYYSLYLGSLQAIQRITDDKLGKLGFQTVIYNGVPVVLDGGYGGGCPSNHMYFLNSEYIFFRPHKKRNFVPLNPDRHAVNQDALVKLIGFMGNMTMSCAFLQAVMFDAA